MSRNQSARSAVAYGFLGIFALALLCSAPFAWKRWRGYADSGKALAARSQGERSLDSIRVLAASAEEQKARLASQAAENAAALERLERKLMPLEAESSRRLKLDLLNLAAKCGLDVEEMQPFLVNGRSRDPESAAPGAPAAAPPAPAGPAAIAFLGRFPPGETYRRPLVSLRCRASYVQVRSFLAELKGLRWQVTPVQFDLRRAGTAGPVAPVAADDEGAAPVAPAAPARWLAGDDELRLTVVLAM